MGKSIGTPSRSFKCSARSSSTVSISRDVLCPTPSRSFKCSARSSPTVSLSRDARCPSSSCKCAPRCAPAIHLLSGDMPDPGYEAPRAPHNTILYQNVTGALPPDCRLPSPLSLAPFQVSPEDYRAIAGYLRSTALGIQSVITHFNYSYGLQVQSSYVQAYAAARFLLSLMYPNHFAFGPFGQYSFDEPYEMHLQSPFSMPYAVPPHQYTTYPVPLDQHMTCSAASHAAGAHPMQAGAVPTYQTAAHPEQHQAHDAASQQVHQAPGQPPHYRPQQSDGVGPSQVHQAAGQPLHYRGQHSDDVGP